MENLEIKNVTFAYPGTDKVILKDIDLHVKAGSFVCILGQSGCGKSTLLRLLAGLEQPTQGELILGDEVITKPSLERGVVFQDYGLFPWMSAGENICLALKQRFPGRKKTEYKELASQLLEQVGLPAGTFDKLPKELSGGMKQRCAIARAFGMDPPVLLMDEPFGALDAVTRARLQDLVLDLWRKGEPQKMVFFVTHDVDEALLLASHIVVLGQSPSHIIYECEVPPERRITRETQFADPETLRLRNTLIQYINQDVNMRVDENR